jgi:hypothetical protein
MIRLFPLNVHPLVTLNSETLHAFKALTLKMRMIYGHTGLVMVYFSRHGNPVLSFAYVVKTLNKKSYEFKGLNVKLLFFSKLLKTNLT